MSTRALVVVVGALVVVVVIKGSVVETVGDAPLGLRVVVDGFGEVLVVIVISLPGRTHATGLRSTKSIKTVCG